MSRKDERAEKAASLRRQAETSVAADKPAPLPEDIETLSPEEARRTRHELRVHEIELMLQNEELRRAQLELETARERYFTLYDLAPVGYVTLSQENLILEINLTAATLLGADRGELLKRPLSRFIVKEDQDRYYLHCKLLSVTGMPQSWELRMLKPDGTRFWVQLQATAAQEGDGLPVSRVAISDITERKRAEEEKVKLEGQLLQAQKMEAVGRLAGGVAHDFNNMLLVILGHVELAFEQLGLGHPLRNDLEEVRKAATRSAELTRQLLAFARKQPVAPRVLDLKETVAEMLKMLPQLIGENIHVVWQPEADLWPVRVDPSQIDQILTNLCINCRDAIGGVGKIIIELGNRTLGEDYCSSHLGCVPGEYVRLVVSDDGCGMDKETLSHIFEPFFTTKGVGEGTGLGLATVYGAVKQNNGFINVYSEPGSGTTFTIYLPRHAGQFQARQSLAATAAITRGHETILLVEDEAAILSVVTKILERYGYTVLAAASPAEAMRLAREHDGRIDLILTDVVMPDMNGRDLAKHLLSLYPHLKRLFMSGYTAEVVAHHGVLDEGMYFIEKPFSIADLAGKVREVLDHV
jgi:PAS domain S-box-containing protein